MGTTTSPPREPVLADPSSNLLVPAIEANVVEALLTQRSRSPAAEVHEERDLLRFVTSIPDPWMNAVARIRLRRSDADRRIEEVLEPCRRRGLPQLWQVMPTTTPPDLGDRLLTHGFLLQEEMPFMAALLHEPREAPKPPGLKVEAITQGSSLEQFLQVFLAGHDMPEERAEVWRPILAGAGPRWRRFVALWEGRPVATAGVNLAGGVAGLYNVTTVPDARRRGMGSAVSLAALHDARARGYRICILGSSAMARGMYQGLGFREVFTAALFMWSPNR